MVETLQPYKKGVEDLKKDLPLELRKILIKNSKRVIDILRKEQLAKNLKSDGTPIGRYTQATEEIAKNPSFYGSTKPRKEKIAGAPYNFEWTGGLFDEMYVFFEDMKSFSLFSEDEKAHYLKEKYGEIYTLTTRNNERINQEILRPEMYELIIQRLFT